MNNNQGKGNAWHFKHDFYHSSSFIASLIIILLDLTYTSLDLFRRGHSYHTLTTPFVDYLSLATPELLLQTSYSSCSDSHSNVQDFMDFIKTLTGQTSAALL